MMVPRGDLAKEKKRIKRDQIRGITNKKGANGKPSKGAAVRVFEDRPPWDSQLSPKGTCAGQEMERTRRMWGASRKGERKIFNPRSAGMGRRRPRQKRENNGQ